MGGTKNTYLDIVQGGMSIDFTMSKKEMKENGKNAAVSIVENGNVRPVEALANAARLHEFLTEFIKEIKTNPQFEAIDKEMNECGIRFSNASTGDKLNFEADEVYKDLQKKLKDRQELLKTARKSDDTIYDSEGVEVPKIGIKTYGRSYLKMEY